MFSITQKQPPEAPPNPFLSFFFEKLNPFRNDSAHLMTRRGYPTSPPPPSWSPPAGGAPLPFASKARGRSLRLSSSNPAIVPQPVKQSRGY